uniref:Retrotransposon gag domain-containing protein n=1 Tax=Vitis vinifera TaxID=29760 RepID=A5BXK4_VITVI|nr:hypothetical protein VITISV_007954 [Vitis vinifera]
MLSTPFSSRIIRYEPPKGFIILKFSTYDGSSDHFDHIMHYRQLMTLDIGNDMLLCKVFPASLQVQALSWFHQLPTNLIDNFWDLSEVFTVLQVESYSMDVVLQIFKRSICSGTPFFESLAKKPPTSMDNLFRCANKYSMLEDDVRAATQQGAGRTTSANHSNASHLNVREATSCDSRSTRIQMARTNKIKSLRKGLQQKMCYIRTTPKSGESSHGHGPRAPTAPVRAIINYIHRGPLDDEYNSQRKRQRLLRAATIRENISSIRSGLASGSIHLIDGTIVFPTIDLARVLQPHRDALVMTLGIRDFDVKRILVDPGSSADLLQVSVVKQMGFIPSSLENPGRMLSGFNGASTTSLGDVILSIQAGPVILNVLFSVVEDLFPFNAILGRMWLHSMKAISSTYHQMVSFITQDGQVDLYGSQLAARQCYQIVRVAGPSIDREHSPKEVSPSDQ